MDFLGSVLEFLDSDMTTPQNYGWFHILCMTLIVALTVFLCVYFKDCSDKTVRRIVLISWIVMTVLEVYKQINFGLSYTDGEFVWDYAWYAFPYQLCSTPLYALPFIAFLKEGKIRDAFMAYMSFFSLFGGIAVFFYPNDVFITTIGINIQTMIHHGLQVVLGIFLAVHQRHKLSCKYFLSSVGIFASFLFIAVLMNFAVYKELVSAGLDDTFNMFYISPYFECSLPVLSLVYTAVPYAVFICVYIFGFTLVAFLLYLIQSAIIKAVSRRCKNGKEK